MEMLVNGRKRDVLIAAEIEVDHYSDTIQGAGEKSDTFKACINILEKDFKIGLAPAKGKLTITAQDDAIKALLQNGCKYRLYITNYFETEPNNVPQTVPTTLTEHLSEDNQPTTVNQEVCPDCGVSVALCQCGQGDAPADDAELE